MFTVRDRRGWERVATVVAVVGALLLVTILVMASTRAAFFDTTDSAGNALAAGDVVLSDDDSGSAMFSVSNMAPGDSAVRCIAVQYDGSIVPADVVLYIGSGDLTGSGLATYLDMTVELGSGGGFADCTGFSGSTSYSGTLSGFASAHSDFGSGAGGWTAVTTGDDRTYRVTLTLQDDNDAQALNADVTFTWEAQNQ